METAGTVAEMRRLSHAWHDEGRSIGLVPTMGSLHEGHASLVERAVAENGRVVVSVFVNPTQFGPGEDLERYPRDIERDSALCASLGADAVFCPAPADMYRGHQTYVEQGLLTTTMEGASRPGHFRGVCTVVAKLFNIVAPTRAYFGQKDAQQLAVIRKMVADLNFDVAIVACPTVREADGLAASSRNAYLSAEEREAARVLSQAIACGQSAIAPGMSAATLVEQMRAVIAAEPRAHIDYIEVVDTASMQPVEAVAGDVTVALAATLGSTRLIDNFAYDATRASQAADAPAGGAA